MKKSKLLLIALNLVLLLGFFTYSIFQKEELLEDGTLVFLELAPVDPRSLMQGDYMRLNYKISREGNDISERGFCIVKLNEKNIAEKVRVQDEKNPLNEGEFLINYTKARWGRINIGAESFFFQEGTGDRYEKAKYGALRIDNKGNSLLVGLYDENLEEIK
ncbi:GDYXXLXY domain-containing protein [Aureivirga sp. CE67]|uniref:GDYXXLXY domain-containing protein n=1 Tax=Aureivirga sp. CE67 TaxID=1788983 RepID=UPI0018C993C4|nr:GDYXXLXY domain-containing protein [Aureivirga sp. CE67]